MRTAAVASLALASCSTLVLAGGGTARVAAGPNFGPARKAIEKSIAAEKLAIEHATNGDASQAEASLTRATTLLDEALRDVRAQPITDTDYTAVRDALKDAQTVDDKALSSGFRYSDDREYVELGISEKRGALEILTRIVEYADKAPVTLKSIADALEKAIAAETEAKQVGTTKASLDASRAMIEQSQAFLRTSADLALQAASKNQISSSDYEQLSREIVEARRSDNNADLDLYAPLGGPPRPSSAVSNLDKGIESKKAALTTLDHAVAHTPTPIGASPLALSPVSAVFVPGDLATRYTVTATDTQPSRTLTYRWVLTLMRVDPVGSSPAGYQSTDPTAANYSSAGFDPTCDNAKLPGGSGDITSTSATYTWSNQANSFEWYHGDAGSYPGSTYGCDHKKMGASGHQGTVTAIVSDGVWICRAKISGSNLTLTAVQGGPATCSRG